MSICFVIFYAGDLPVWFDAFMLSCRKNKEINWLIFTDAAIPKKHPQNITFKHLNLKAFNKLAGDTTKLIIKVKMPYKICDFKPLYGDIFKTYLNNYEYWGHCDLDLVWGDLEDFYKNIDYKKYDIISSRKNAISGHCTIYKNSKRISNLYKEIKDYQKPLLDISYAGFDEGYYSYYIYTLFKETTRLKIYWQKNFAVERYTLRRNPIGWYWKNGRIFSKTGNEHLYLHFLNWKKSIQKIDFNYIDKPNQFYFCKTGMFTNKESIKLTLNNYPIKTPFYKLKFVLKNLFKRKAKELANYHPNYLRIEDRYNT